MRWFAAYALLPGGLARNVILDVSDGLFRSVTSDCERGDATPLPGLVMPGFANAHSHAFHRALRGRTAHGRGDFWSWRTAMYEVASRLDPDSYFLLARATYAEMVLAGVTAVGEFHYLHHAPGGASYGDPNAMAEALRHAAAEAGIRLTLLDTCYLAGGLEADGFRPLEEVQRRFGDESVDRWAERFTALKSSEGMRVGAAIHSVRAVPRAAMSTVRDATAGRPLHAHLSEQPAENAASEGFYGCTPTQLLAAEGVLGPMTTAVHATHLTPADISTLGASGTIVCLCPTTERDLGDGIGPARALRDAGCPLSLGSDQHVVTDLLAEARALEMDERLASGRRGCFTPSELLGALTAHPGIGWPECGRLEAGAAGDLVAIRLDTVRTAGCAPGQAALVAGAADVDTVMVGGVVTVEGGHHRLGDVAALLAAAVDPLWENA